MTLHASHHLKSRCSRENSGIRTTSLSSQQAESYSLRVDRTLRRRRVMSHFLLVQIFQNAQLIAARDH